MGKGSGTTAVAILALLIGASGLGVGYYGMNKANSTEGITTILFLDQIVFKTGIINTWYNYDGGTFYPSVGSWDTHDSLTVNFNVNPRESVIYSFCCFLFLYDSDSTGVSFEFIVDGIRYTHPYTRVRANPNSISMCFSVSLQNATPISPGPHSVSITLLSDSADDYIRYSSLIVQTYIP